MSIAQKSQHLAQARVQYSQISLKWLLCFSMFYHLNMTTLFLLSRLCSFPGMIFEYKSVGLVSSALKHTNSES
jgi:hypothetical protein